MLKKLIWGTVAAAVVAAVILGPRSLWTTLRGARDVANQEVEDSKPDVQRAAEIRVGLRDLDERVQRFGDRVAEVEGRAGQARRRLEANEQELARQRGLLVRARTLLGERRDSYQVGGRSYSRAEVNADALARLSRCQQLTRQVELDRNVTRQLGEAAAEARTSLARAQRVRQETAGQLAALEARLENARLLEQVNDLTRDLQAGPLGPQTELARQLEAFERRVAQVERRARPGEGGGRGAIVDWEGSGGAPDAREAIARFLGEGGVRTTAAAH